jgi:hypothetical protein
MDNLDQILSKNPKSDLPDGFSDRIRLNFRRKYHFRQRMLILAAVLFIIAGFIVVFPEVTKANEQLTVQTGILSSMPTMGLSSELTQNSAAGIWQGITDTQDTIIAAFSLPAWLGLFSVGIGSIIGIGGFFPRLRTR